MTSSKYICNKYNRYEGSEYIIRNYSKSLKISRRFLSKVGICSAVIKNEKDSIKFEEYWQVVKSKFDNNSNRNTLFQQNIFSKESAEIIIK